MNQCMKCCMKIDFQYICKNCAEKCHKEHDNISRIYSQLLNIRTAQNGKNSFKKTSFILIIDTIYYN